MLSDPDRRSTYDRYGLPGLAAAAEDDSGIQFGPGTAASTADWQQYLASLYGKRLNMNMLDAFRAEYVGSCDEADDLEAMYCKYEGNMLSIIDAMPFGTDEDIPRYIAIMQDRLSKQDNNEQAESQCLYSKTVHF